MSSTAVLILNWNGHSDTIYCLSSLIPNLDQDDYLFIIDNGSTDNSIEKITEYFDSRGQLLTLTTAGKLSSVFDPAKKNYLVCNPGNLGFGAGNNVVLKQLTTLSAHFKLAWLLNNDTVVAKNTLIKLKTAIGSTINAGVAGSLLLNYPDNGTIQCSGVKYYKFFGVSKLINKNKPYKDFDKHELPRFDYLNGASILLRLEALTEVGYFDERFFLYSEEHDLEMRIEKGGYTLCLEPDSIVYHKLGGGTRSNRFLFYYYYNLSAVLLSKKHFSVLYTFCAVFNLLAVTFIRTFPTLKNFVWGVKGIIKGLKK